jgi:hypothetical protein
MKPVARAIAWITPLLLAASLAGAQPAKQTLWKVVDKNGKVTYYDQEPKGVEGQVTKIEMNLESNRAAPPKVPPPSTPAQSGSKESRRAAADADLARAQERLDAARKALADGREPTPEETSWVGKQGGGARPVPTAAYDARLRRLEDAVKAAEADVERAQSAARQAAID